MTHDWQCTISVASNCHTGSMPGYLGRSSFLEGSNTLERTGALNTKRRYSSEIRELHRGRDKCTATFVIAVVPSPT